MGYITFKRQVKLPGLDDAVKEWEASGPQPAKQENGASSKEIKQAWRDTSDYRDFNERLPQEKRTSLLSEQVSARKEVDRYDQQGQGSTPPIVGVYLDVSS